MFLTSSKLIRSYMLNEAGPSTKSTGIYELIGVVSHKGLTAASGHYVGWVKKDGQAYFPCSRMNCFTSLFLRNKELKISILAFRNMG